MAATLATGLEPAPPGPIPDTAFKPVSLPNPIPDAALKPATLSSDQAAAGSLLAPTATDALPVLRDPMPSPKAAERAQPAVRVARPITVVIPPPKPKVTAAPSTKTANSISGLASWYCRAGVSPCTYTHPDGGGFDAYAAAGPRLRAAIGSGWRGTIISVDGVRVKLIDWCQCYQGEPHEKLLDLYYDVFSRTGSSVTVRW